MDIVHLMESSVETSRDHGRSYAEIERTVGLDHSEGKGKFTSACSSLSNFRPHFLDIEPPKFTILGSMTVLLT